MTRAPRLFRMLWRVNAVVILMTGVLLSVLALAGLVLIAREATRERVVHDSARLDPEVVKGEVFELRSMRRLRGTPVMLLELTSSQRHSAGSYSKEAPSVRNLLFYDSETAKSRWLFERYGLLVDIRPLAEHGDDKARVRWIMLEAVTQDTNRDNRLSMEDQKVLGVVDADGQNYKDVLQGVERVLGVEFTGDDVVDVAFSGTDGDYVAEIDLSRREVRRRTLLRYHARR